MRIGIVPFLNARPLDFGFRNPLHFEKKWEQIYGEIEIFEDLPSRLSDSLQQGKLDVALISSIECFRHKETLDYCKQVGVCCKGKVISVLYVCPKGMKREASIEVIYTDRASRTSIALWQCLYLQSHSHLPEQKTIEAKKIPTYIKDYTAGLLIGDAALEFSLSEEAKLFEVYDIGEWWESSQGGLPFVYALWAFPKDKPIDDNFFLSSLEYGIKNIDEIINFSKYPIARSYLQKHIYYKLGTKEKQAIENFLLIFERYQLK